MKFIDWKCAKVQISGSNGNVIIQNDILEEIKHTGNMGNVCYYSLEKILSSRLLSNKLKVCTYKTIILPVVLYGCGTLSHLEREAEVKGVWE